LHHDFSLIFKIQRSEVVRVLACSYGVCEFNSRQGYLFSTYGGGSVQYIFWWGGNRPGRIMTNRKHLTPIPHRRLHLYHTFTGLQDAYTLHQALNRSCPRCHLHTWNNDTLIPLIGNTVWTEDSLVFYLV